MTLDISQTEKKIRANRGHGVKPELFTNARTIRIRVKVVFAELLKVIHQIAGSLICDFEDLQILKMGENRTTNYSLQ